MDSDLGCQQMAVKKFCQIGVKKVEKNSLPKPILKLKKRKEFILLRKNGLCKKSKFFIINYQNTTDFQKFVGLTVSKKVGGAVVRNYIKRLLRSIVTNNIKNIPNGLVFEIIPKKGVEKTSYHLLEKDLVDTLKKLKI